MTLAQLQDYTFNTKYARYNPAIGRRETFAEAADRVFSMHEGKYARFGIQEQIEYAKAAVKDRLVLGAADVWNPDVNDPGATGDHMVTLNFLAKYYATDTAAIKLTRLVA